MAVTPKSSLRLRREVERFAIYFRREFDYDFQQFEATERPRKAYAAYLFTSEPNCFPRMWAGACCFRWREYKEMDPRWAVQWIWLHPYYRSKGILGRAWERFHELHGNFICEPPLSPAMEAFLKKRGKCVICWRALPRRDGVLCTHCKVKDS